MTSEIPINFKMGFIEEVFDCFRQMKSYERVWLLCKLLNCCVPFELRFLATCIEDLGAKDQQDLRQIEVDANSELESKFDEFNINNMEVQQKLSLYLSLLRTGNEGCSANLYKILSNVEQIDTLVKSGTVTGEETPLECILTVYTLAMHHPAFSFEQRRVLGNIFNALQVESKKRSDVRAGTVHPPSTGCVSQTDSSPEEFCSEPQSQILQNTEGSPVHGSEPLSIGMPAPGFIRYAYPVASTQLLPSSLWQAGIPVVLNTEQVQAPVPAVASGSSKSESSSRCTSPSPKLHKICPMSVPYIRPAQQYNAFYFPPVSAALTAVGSNYSPPPLDIASNTPQQLSGVTDEEFSALGFSDEHVQQLRATAKKDAGNPVRAFDFEHQTRLQNKRLECYSDFPTGGTERYISTSVNHTYQNPHPMEVIPGQPVFTVPCNCCYATTPVETNGGVTDAIEDMNALKIECDNQSQVSNSSGSTSVENSPPTTPDPHPVSAECKNDESRLKEVNLEEKQTADNAESEDRQLMPPPPINSGHVPRRRTFTNRGRTRSLTGGSYNRRNSHSNTRRSSDTTNGGATEDQRKQYNVENSLTFSTSNTNSNSVSSTNSSFVHPQQYVRSYASFTPNNFIRPAYPFPPNGGDMVYHRFHGPASAFMPTTPAPAPVAAYPQMAAPKVSCYNCGSRDHVGQDCPDLTIEESSKQGNYRIDFGPAVAES